MQFEGTYCIYLDQSGWDVQVQEDSWNPTMNTKLLEVQVLNPAENDLEKASM